MALNLNTETVFTDDAAAAQPPLPREQIAPHFPQLEILECLGRGGMGVVYKARQKSLNRFVALKLVAPERVNDAKFAGRFAREAQALAALNHPNIVTIYDFGQAGGFYFLLMEFVDGMNLRHLLRARKFTPEEALAIVPSLCDALQFAHERGIVHRDIKPENILLDKTGRVKVADFGIAKMLGNGNGESSSAAAAPDNATQSALGTPGYSAPEQKSNPQRVDSRADIYSLGVVFYEMLTGELPGKQLQPPSKKVSIDVRLDEVVLRALEKKPELRYQQASEVKTMVETIASTPAATKTPAWKVYVPSVLAVLPMLFIWFCSNVFVLPKVKNNAAHYPPGYHPFAGFPPTGFADWLNDYWTARTVLIIIALVILAELFLPVWRRQRRRLAWTVVVLVNGVTLLTLVTLFAHAMQNPDPPRIIAQTIQREVGLQLQAAGAGYDSLQVTVAEPRDSATPFTVSYKGLRHFKYTNGGQPDRRWPASADGQFIMHYIGGGQWQGALGDTQFTVQVGRTDNIDLPFVNDPEVLGTWATVDYVENPEDFNPANQAWKGGEFVFKGITFHAEGKTSYNWYRWTKGVVMHLGDKTAEACQIRQINGQPYLFLECKNGDWMFAGRKPSYAVLRKVVNGSVPEK